MFGKDCVQSPPEVQPGVRHPNRATILTKQTQEQERIALKNAAHATALQDLETLVGVPQCWDLETLVGNCFKLRAPQKPLHSLLPHHPL
jgi:hypothetical protein